MLLISVGKNLETDRFRLIFRENALSNEIVIDDITREDFKQLMKWGIEYL
jgi:hypothetical protein